MLLALGACAAVAAPYAVRGRSDAPRPSRAPWLAGSAAHVPQTAYLAGETSGSADAAATTVSASNYLPVHSEDAAAEAGYEGDAVSRKPRGGAREPGPARLSKWNLAEYEALAASTTEKADPLSVLPTGAVTLPPTPLDLEEVLAANQAERPIDYAEPGDTVKPGPLPAGQIELDCPQYYDYDEERHFVYAIGRPTARYGAQKLTADRLLVDTRLREIQAYGNVILTSEGQHVEAESLWVSTLTNQGVAYNCRGRNGPFYFLGEPFKGDGTTTFRQLSKSESHFKDASFTTCDFTVPHFRVRAKEFSIYNNDRIFARNVVVYVHEVPVLWLPYYTMSLKEGIPWGASIGSDNSLGAFVRVFYDYYNSCYVPSDADEGTMIRSSFQHARLRGDFFSKRGFGKGLEYSYEFDQGRHRGNLDVYQINDKERDVDGSKGESRSYVNWFHRTRITEELAWMVDVDYVSDPDIFYDIFDRLRGAGEAKRERIPERKISTGFEWTAENFFAGLQVELKDRIGRDRVSYFADPKDNDYDYDRAYNNEVISRVTPPGTVGGEAVPYDGFYTRPLSVNDEDLDNGVSSDRYGRVTERLPQITISTNRLRLGTSPWWYHMDLNIINNLDKGLNTVGTRDDAFVRGFDLYQSLTNLLRLGERATLTTKFGLGFGIADREKDSYNLDFPDNATFPFVYDGQLINGEFIGMTFLDRDTFLVGTKRYSLKDVSPEFFYGDVDSKFQYRITEALTAYIRYRLREGNDDNLGQFYENIGNRMAKDDLYAFRTKEHWLEGGFVYNLLYPRLNLNLSAGKNLQGEGDITPNEIRHYANAGVGWSNEANTTFLNSGVTIQNQQLRDPTDPNQFQQNSTTYYVAGSYIPVHRRYYARIGAYFLQNANSDPLGTSPNDSNLDSQNNTNLNMTVGRKLGTKYLVEVASNARTNSGSDNNNVTDTYVRVKRDFHDMIGVLSVGQTTKKLSDNSEGTESGGTQVRFSVQFKKPGEKGLPPYSRQADLFSRSKVGAFETGG